MLVQNEIVQGAKPLAIGILHSHSFQNGELMVSPRLGALIGHCRTYCKKKAGEYPRDAHSHEKSIGQTQNRLNRLLSPCWITRLLPGLPLAGNDPVWLGHSHRR